MSKLSDYLPKDSAQEILNKVKTVDGIGSGLDTDLFRGLDDAHYKNWNNITNKPSTYPPSAHNHSVSDITGLGGVIVPSGIICMWSGAVGSVPSGWALCNGTNGTPDLRDRFIVGAGSTYGVGAKGGSANAVVVSHSHTASTGSAGGHGHTASTGSAGAHTHGITMRNRSGVSSNTESIARGLTVGNNSWGGWVNINGPSSEAQAASAGAHSHTVSVSAGGAHTHTVSVGSSGESGANKNLPPYYALAFIMKL